MLEAKLSSKNQIVIPYEARNALGIKSGAKLLVIIRGDTIILLRKPQSYSAAISGIGKSIYSSNYLKKERKEWN